MTEGIKNGLIIFVMATITSAFCVLFYPPITEKIKRLIDRNEKNIYNNSKVYGSFAEAIKSIIYNNILVATFYVIYFFVATQYLVFKFGIFTYGDNGETFIYLIWVGIPYVASYLHFVIKANNHQIAICKSNIKTKDNDSKVFWYTFYTPMLLLIVVQKIFHISIKYADSNIFSLLSNLK